MTICVVFDGPDYSGKTTLIQNVTEILQAMDITVAVRNHPSSATETGIAARRSLISNEASALTAKAMVADFHYTLDNLPDVDVVLLDRWTPVTLVNQGVEGKEVVFTSGILTHPNAPTIYVSVSVPYEVALARSKTRQEASGADWDAAVSNRILASKEAYQETVEAYEKAFQIIANQGRSDLILLAFDTSSKSFSVAIDVALTIDKVVA